jgi:plastocyanin
MNTSIKNIITFIAVVIAVLGAGYIIFQKQEPQEKVVAQTPTPTSTPTPAAIVPPAIPPPAPAPQVSAPLVVIYTDSGYQPQSLTIKKGDAVTFNNKSTQGMWTASALHPTHKEYPTTGGCIGSTFDSCASTLPGTAWSFTFDMPGTWRYHNHVHPGHYGSITVE